MKLVAGSVGAIVLGVAIFEIAMRPGADERWQILAIFGSMALVAAAVGYYFPRFSRLRSLRLVVVFIALTSLVLTSLSAVVSAALMDFNDHDLALLTVVLVFAVVQSLVTAAVLTKPMTADLAKIRTTALVVADGSLDVATGVSRRDELGDAAAAIDDMIVRLRDATDQQQRVQHARRMLLSSVGHDLRSPLAALRATVEALEDGVASDPQRYLSSMRADVDALSRLIEDLFLLSAIEAGGLRLHKVPVDLPEIADESLDALRPVAMQRDVDLRLQGRQRLMVPAAPGEIGRVIRNLVDNAIRHAPEASTVTVTITKQDRAYVSVHDEGKGFPADLIGSAFDDFVTGDPARRRIDGGVGLGLAIARGLVSSHEGHIWIDPGPGGRVTFDLPLGEGS